MKKFNYDYDNAGKTKLSKAFKALRKEGLIAKQNFACCGSCGCYEIGEQAKLRAKLIGKFPKGYVFFNRQSTQSMYQTGTVHLSYAAFYSRNDVRRKECFTDVEIGNLIVDKMSEVGLATEWDGDTDRCVLVDVESETINMAMFIESIEDEIGECQTDHLFFEHKLENARTTKTEKRYSNELDRIENRIQRLYKRVEGLS
jgi:hypothetical protein